MAGSTHAEGGSRRALIAACAGNAVEWYDLALLGGTASVIAVVLTPGGWAGFTTVFAVFATSCLFRPLGSLIIGARADRFGRQPMLAMTILVMAVATFAIGLLPPWSMIGLLAPLGLLALRAVQAFSVGGEIGVSVAYLSELGRGDRRGQGGGWYLSTVAIGLALGLGVTAVLATLLDPAALASWGWRVPFLLALPLGFVGVYLRRRLIESPSFAAGGGRGAAPAVGGAARSPADGAPLPGDRRGAYSAAFNVWFLFVPSYVAATGAAPLGLAPGRRPGRTAGAGGRGAAVRPAVRSVRPPGGAAAARVRRWPSASCRSTSGRWAVLRRIVHRQCADRAGDRRLCAAGLLRRAVPGPGQGDRPRAVLRHQQRGDRRHGAAAGDRAVPAGRCRSWCPAIWRCGRLARCRGAAVAGDAAVAIRQAAARPDGADVPARARSAPAHSGISRAAARTPASISTAVSASSEIFPLERHRALCAIPITRRHQDIDIRRAAGQHRFQRGERRSPPDRSACNPPGRRLEPVSNLPLRSGWSRTCSFVRRVAVDVIHGVQNVSQGVEGRRLSVTVTLDGPTGRVVIASLLTSLSELPLAALRCGPELESLTVSSPPQRRSPTVRADPGETPHEVLLA